MTLTPHDIRKLEGSTGKRSRGRRHQRSSVHPTVAAAVRAARQASIRVTGGLRQVCFICDADSTATDDGSMHTIDGRQPIDPDTISWFKSHGIVL